MGTYTSYHISSGGYDRTYSVYVPTTPLNPAPFVHVAHGDLGTPDSMLGIDGISGITHYGAVAEANGFVVAAGQGINQHWNSHFKDGPWDDKIFILDMITDINRRNPINMQKLYAAGYSNGAGFTNALGRVYAGTFAAIACNSGLYVAEELAKNGPPRHPIPLIENHGGADIVWLYGGFVDNANNITYVDTDLCLAQWGLWNGASGPTFIDSATDGVNGTTANRSKWFDPMGRGEIQHYKVLLGGHQWLGGTKITGLGNICTVVDFSAVSWAFFNRFSRTTITRTRPGNGARGHNTRTHVSRPLNTTTRERANPKGF